MTPVDTLIGLLGLMRVFTTDLVGHIVFWPALVVVAGLLAFLARRSLPALREKAWVLPLLPLCWIAVGLFGVFFTAGRDGAIRTGNSSAETTIVFGFVAFLLVWVSVIYALKDAKLFAALWAVTNLYFMVGMSVIAYMAVSAIWP